MCLHHLLARPQDKKNGASMWPISRLDLRQDMSGRVNTVGPLGPRGAREWDTMTIALSSAEKMSRMSITLTAWPSPFWAELSSRVLRLVPGGDFYFPPAQATAGVLCDTTSGHPANYRKAPLAAYRAGGFRHGTATRPGIRRWPQGQSAGALCGTGPTQNSSALITASGRTFTDEMAMFFRDENELTLTREWEDAEGLSPN